MAEARRDTLWMSQTPPAGETANTVVGRVFGNVIQAQAIHGGVHLHPPVRHAVELPHRAGVFPPRAAAFRSRRTAELLLAENPGPEAPDRQARTSVVTGLGGVGKTQVAVDYAERMWDSGAVDLVVWVTATSRAAILSSYARLAVELTAIEDGEPEHAAQRLLEWLATTSSRWLIVLDDLQAPRDLQGLWPPTTSTGRVVVTTRRRDAALRGHRRAVVEVHVFDASEASAYLRAFLAERPHLQTGADDLAAALGFLPLALSQAGAYMLDRELTCVDYLKRVNDRRRSLASLVPEPDGLPDEHKATVAASWSLSVEQANRLEPAGVAGPLLEVASLLDPNGAPAGVFTTDVVVDVVARATGRLADSETAWDGLGCLHRLNLITLDGSSPYPSVRTHALVQRATLEAAPADRLPSVVRAVADALLLIWPEVEKDLLLGQIMRANADAVVAAGTEHLWGPDTHSLVFRSGTSRGESGLVAEAAAYFRELAAAAADRLGPEHPQVLAARHQLAHWSGEAGNAAGAVAAFRNLLADRMRVLGAGHLDTLATRDSLARWLGESSDPAGAADALAEALTEYWRVLGQDHPVAFTTRHHLAYWRARAGDPAGAATALEELLADCWRTPVTGQVETLAIRRDLAYCYGRSGDAVRAVVTLEDLVADSLRQLGPDSPEVLTTRNNLAYWRGRAGDLAGAVTAFEELVADRLRVLGPAHPATLIARSNLADWRGRAGDPAGAVAALEALVTDFLRVVGSDHVETLTARSNLAYCLGRSGDLAGAVRELDALLADRSRILGPDHLHTIATRHNLAYWRARAGDPAGGATALRAMLVDCHRVLGADHPETLTARGNLARCRGETGDLAGAVTALESLLADRVRVLGPDHLSTLATRQDLAYWGSQLARTGSS